MHFGILVFDPGVRGSAVKDLGSGVWFYPDGGKYPKK
jgi:hypothetical protein